MTLGLRITQHGIERLASQVAVHREQRAPHHQLAEALAAHLRSQGRAVWINIELAPVVDGMTRLVRPDVFSLAMTRQIVKVDAAVHEVKVSRADFLADLAKPEKRGGYAAISEKLYYAAPEGIIWPEELPPGIGLLVQRGDTFAIAKRPVRRRQALPAHILLSLALKSNVVLQNE